MRPAGNLAGVEFIAPPHSHRDADKWREIISGSGYFFTKSALKFFNSQFYWSDLVTAGDACFFITSEKDTATIAAWNGQRRYTLRAWTKAGGVDTIGEFGQYKTLTQARAALQDHDKKQLTEGKNNE